ncbi:MAG: ABC transporter ATP-binding protein [Candidatus Coprovivens sp.]
MEKLVEVKSINKFFGKKQVLKNVSFNICEGQILGFIGPNGAGKTTTIKLLLGLQKIDSGNVLINGFDVVKDFEKAILRVGAIVENPDYYMYLTGRKNLEMISSLYKDISKERVDEIIKIVGLENRINDKVKNYSLGMRQRLGIAAALIHNPNVLILDEPTNGLDPEGIKDLKELLVKLAKKEKMGVLVSSHNLLDLESFCTDVCLIKNGEIITSASMEEIKNVGKSSYLIKLENTNDLKNILNDDDIIIDEKHIKVFVEEKDVPKLLKKLIDNNKKIYEVRKDFLTLEDAFISKTGGNVID